MNEKLTILLRTSNRPHGFKRMLESIKSQTYLKNCNLIVSVDDDDSEKYVKEAGISGYIRFNREPRQHPSHNPYNLYFNHMISNVNNGWIYCVDDDDYLHDDRVFERMIQTLKDPNKIYIFKLLDIKGDKTLPSHSFGEYLARGDISTQCFVVHSKHASRVKWRAIQAGDYFYIRDLIRIMGFNSVKWIDDIIYTMDRRDGLGNRKDINED